MYGFETANFLVRHYHRSAERLVVVFTSAGGQAPGGTVEEFRTTLSHFDVSTVFVSDRHARWYNHSDTHEVFAEVAGIARRYDYVGALGESMGGCGAIAFSAVCRSVTRVLAFAPQYSIAHPYIAFDERYSWIGAEMGAHVFTDFACGRPACDIRILCGDEDWRDGSHAAAFTAVGYAVSTVIGGPHDLAGFLKRGPLGNRLSVLVGMLCDFSGDFRQCDIRRAA